MYTTSYVSWMIGSLTATIFCCGLGGHATSEAVTVRPASNDENSHEQSLVPGTPCSENKLWLKCNFWKSDRLPRETNFFSIFRPSYSNSFVLFLYSESTLWIPWVSKVFQNSVLTVVETTNIGSCRFFKKVRVNW